MDMFEPQDHPNDIPYPGGPPTPPYDNAGWTLAYQMGVQVRSRARRLRRAVREACSGLAKPAPGTVDRRRRPPATYFSHAVNDAFTASIACSRRGEDVSPGYAAAAPGGHVLRRREAVDARGRREAGRANSASASKAPRRSSGRTRSKLRKLRIALSDRYGGSMPSGWTRFLLEQFEFPFEVVYPPTLDAGNLIGKYDVIIFRRRT